MKLCLAEQGVITMEFPHLLRLMEETQYDTIYHEHYSYLSFLTTRRVFEHHGLELFDVEELPSHGGSLRIFAQHAGGHVAASVRFRHAVGRRDDHAEAGAERGDVPQATAQMLQSWFDRLSGGSGRDRLSGGSGTDRCSGGSGRDRKSSCERSSSIP